MYCVQYLTVYDSVKPGPFRTNSQYAVVTAAMNLYSLVIAGWAVVVVVVGGGVGCGIG
jgi:hypothetical protein